MAFIRKSFVKETTTTTGTGAVSLLGARAPGQAFSVVCANADTCKYAISHTSLNEWEVGLGTYATAGNTLTRTTVLESSNANAAVTFSAGTKNVDMVVDATDVNAFLSSPGSSAITTVGTLSAGDATGVVSAGTSGAAGKLQLATRTELLTGSDTAKAVTSNDVWALLEKGTDNSGGATITLGDGYQFDLITSTTTITAIAFTTDKAGRRSTLRFATARTVTHNATSLISPTSGNLAMGVGDLMEVESLGGGNFRILWFSRADVAQGPGVGVITANAAATNATTNLSCGVFTIPANTLRVGSVYRLQGHYTFLRTTTPPTITMEVVIGGSVVESMVVTFNTTASTSGGWVDALVTCKTVGSSGTVMVSMTQYTNGGTAISSQILCTTTSSTDTINTTTALTLELRMRMTTAVASNTLTVIQGITEKVL